MSGPFANHDRVSRCLRVLGIDPGLAITGYGLIEDSQSGRLKVLEAGYIKTSPSSGIGNRLAKIYTGLEGLVKEARPAVIALEGLYSHYKHPTSVIMMGHARGIVCLLAGIQKIRLVNYPATKIKKAITGNGHASKTQVQRTVQGLLGLKAAPEPVDVSDALAAALSHFYIDKKRCIYDQ